MAKVKVLCICTILAGVLLFILTYFILSPSSYVYQWLIGLASAMIILGLGYLTNVLIMMNDCTSKSNSKNMLPGNYRTSIKEKSGYLVCKIMNILLCIYLLVLNEINTTSIIMILGIALVVIQFVLDLIFQIYFLCRNREE